MPSNKEVYPEEVLSPERIQSFITATQTLRAQAAGHAELGRFSLAERDEDYFQDFREVYFEPVADPSLEKINAMSTALMGKPEDQPGAPYFEQLRDAFRKKPHVLEDAKQFMYGGKKIMIITNHAELADVAMVMAAFLCEVGDPGLIRGTRLFVGPIVKELEVTGDPVISALQESSGVFVAFPDTDNTDKKIQEELLDPTLKSETNKAMLKEFMAQMGRGEIALSVVAVSGSTDDKTKSGLTIMKKVSQGTAALARKYHDYVLPVAISMGGDRIGFEVGDLQSLHQEKSIHDVMEGTLAPMYARTSGKKVIYERPVPAGISLP